MARSRSAGTGGPVGSAGAGWGQVAGVAAVGGAGAWPRGGRGAWDDDGWLGDYDGRIAAALDRVRTGLNALGAAPLAEDGASIAALRGELLAERERMPSWKSGCAS